MIPDSEFRNRAGERIDHTFHSSTQLDTLVILGHGVTGNKDRPHLLALAEGLAARGWPCLRISFSGNGNSEGKFEDSCISKGVSDLQSVLSYVPDSVKIAYVGHSMGGAVGVLTAARDMRVRVLVSLAGMTHTEDFVSREFGDVTPGDGLMWEDKNCPLSETYVNDLNQIRSTLSAAEAVTQPWLLVHGDADDVVPIQDSRDAYEAAAVQKKFVEIPGAGHSFDESNYPLLIDEVDGWLTAVLGKS